MAVNIDRMMPMLIVKAKPRMAPAPKAEQDHHILIKVVALASTMVR